MHVLLAAALLVGAPPPSPSSAQDAPGPAVSQASGPKPTGQLKTPQKPEEREGLITIDAVSATVRPERRDFSEELMRQLRLPQGFQINVFAQGLENPRTIAVAPDGSVYVAEREAGRVRLLRDTNGDGRADISRIVAEGLGEKMEGVHGLTVHEGRLYMVTVNELHSAPIQQDGGLGERETHLSDLPDGGQHPNRTMKWGPAGLLYVSVGSQTNAVPEPGEETATMMRADPNTWTKEVYARGLRNTIGFDWHPRTGQLFGLDHNTDHRGNDWPPEELNLIEPGRHYGWPFCGGNREVDWHVAQDPDEEDAETREEFCQATDPPVLTYTAHAAPMQMIFYKATQFPEEYRWDAFATMRGSWNRNPPIGYEVVRIRFDESGKPTGIEPFVSGWLIEGGRAHFGRLMGLAQAADGSLLVGDDSNGVIYRISYGGGTAR
jgi:glucose/arabinose dehydrogenase